MSFVVWHFVDSKEVAGKKRHIESNLFVAAAHVEDAACERKAGSRRIHDVRVVLLQDTLFNIDVGGVCVSHEREDVLHARVPGQVAG